MLARLRLLFISGFIALTTVASASESWQPHEHPAQRERTVVGFFTPAQRMHLASDIGQRITAVHVDIGDTCEPDSPVVVFDSSLAEAEHQRLQAALQGSQAQRRRAENSRARAQRELAYRQSEWQRLQQIDAEAAVSQVELDAARHARDLAEFATSDAEIAIAAARSAEAEIAAALERSQRFLARHRVTAPAHWVVTARHVHPGSHANPGEPLLELADVSRLRLRVMLDHAEIRALRQREHLSVMLPHRDSKVPVTVFAINAAFDRVSKKRAVILEWQPSEEQTPVESGERAVLRLALPDPDGGLLVPAAFVERHFEQYFAEDESGERYDLHILRRDGDAYVVDPQTLPEAVRLRAIAKDR